MSLLSAADQAKLTALSGLMSAARRGTGPVVQVCELVAVDWPAPDGRIFYSSTYALGFCPALQAHLGDARLQTRMRGGDFLDVTRDSGISDDSVTLDFIDFDRGVADLFEAHGEGVRVEVYFYFPQVDLMLSMWFGHLRPPDEADEEHFACKAENGFMSVLLPLPRRAFFSTCQAVFGALLATQDEIDEHDCPYNRHLPGGTIGNLDPATGLPYTFCPRNDRAACSARLGDDLSYLAFDTLVHTYAVGNRGAVATTRGNENNLKRPLRALAGERTVRDLDLLAYVVEVGNPAHPERGSISLLYAISEGRLHSLGQPKVGQIYVQPQHYATRLGWPRQPALGFIAGAHNYPQTALLHVVLQGDYRNTDPASFATEIRAQGSDDVRVYASETEFSEEYSRSRAWWLAHLLRHKRYGMGHDVRRLAIEADFIPLDQWFSETVSFKDGEGNTYTGPRTAFDADLGDRTAQQQINDICLAGRCTVPFPYQGKLRVFPLKKLTQAELDAALVFTDYDSGFERNIVRDPETNKSSLTWSQMSDAELPNAIKVTFDDRDKNFEEHPLLFDSVAQQLRAGRAFGDTGRRAVEKSYGLVGVTYIGEASRCGVLLRDLGEFDEGGLENNQRVRFQTFFTWALELYKSKVIRVLARTLINRKTGVQRFEYFRVRHVRQLNNLIYEVSAQAYPVEYYERTEDLITPIGDGGGSLDENPGGGRGALPFKPVITSLDFNNDQILIQLARGA